MVIYLPFRTQRNARKSIFFGIILHKLLEADIYAAPIRHFKLFKHLDLLFAGDFNIVYI